VTSAEVLAFFDEEAQPTVLTRSDLYISAPSRDGATTGREQLGRVILHKPRVAVLLPSDFPPLSLRRPDFSGLRHVLAGFSFMLDRLPPRHSYESATVTVMLDHPDAVVLAQRPSWLTTDTESSDSTTTEFSAALNGLARLGAQRTRVQETTQPTSRLPVVTAENRGPAGFGWHYQAQDGAPLFARVEFAKAVIEMPRAVRELSGSLSAEAVITAPRYGVLTKSKAVPATPPVPFRLPLGAVD
jgi:hypothetical protein